MIMLYFFADGSFIDYEDKIHKVTITAIVEDNKIRLGVSICNPLDKYDKSIGIAKSLANAQKSNRIVTFDIPSMITISLVNSLMKEQLNYVITNPGAFIKGYGIAKDKYQKKLLCKEIYNRFNDKEKEIFEYLWDSKNSKQINNFLFLAKNKFKA